MAYTLLLLRHGHSDWNAKNLFTGWVDVDLNDQGREEAVNGGNLLKDKGVLPTVVHTSVLRRAITTANLALDAADRHWIPVKRSWRLNERHYGALQGKDKKQTLAEFGEEQFMLWRRSFDTPTPPIDAGSTPSRPARIADAIASTVHNGFTLMSSVPWKSELISRRTRLKPHSVTPRFRPSA